METGKIELTIKEIPVNEELVDSILELRGWTEDKKEYIRECLKYNIITSKQFAELTGIDNNSTITSRMQPKYDKNKGSFYTLLDHCTPFKNMETTGPIFIVRNEKCDKYLWNCK